MKASKDEMEKIVWNKLWIIRSRGFKIKNKILSSDNLII